MEPLSKSDLLFITRALYPEIDPAILDQMVTFNMKVIILSVFINGSYLIALSDIKTVV